MVGFRIPPTVLHQAVFQQAVLFCFAHFLLFFLLLIPLNPNILHALESNMKPLRQRRLALHKGHL